MSLRSTVGTARAWLVVRVAIVFASSISSGASFLPLCSNTKLLARPTILLSSSSADSSHPERDELLQRAWQLRQEASELESKLVSQRKKRAATTTNESAAAAASVCPPTYHSLSDSVWMFSYRFSDQPESRTKKDETIENATTTTPPRTFYAGKLTLKLRSDGFTDIVSHASTSSSLNLDIIKAWGWDVEMSNQDKMDYVMFSVDAVVPVENDTAAATTKTQRFYFQARLEKLSGGLALKEGTVTVKQDVVDSKAPVWGLFSPRGILAEFRRVGDFNAKPTRIVVEEK